MIHTPRQRRAMLALAALCLIGLSAAAGLAAQEFHISFTNGDRLSGRPEKIGPDSLEFVLAQGGARLSLPLAQVRSLGLPGLLEEEEPVEEEEYEGSSLHFADGGVLRGSFLGFEEGKLRFESALLGKQSYAFAALGGLRVGGLYPPLRQGDAGLHEFSTKAGALLLGTPKPEGAATVIVESPEARSSLQVSAISGMLFPDREQRSAPAARLLLADRSEVFASGLALAEGTLSFTYGGGAKGQVKLAELLSLDFIGEGGGDILVWLGGDDSRPEARATRSVFAAADLPAGWRSEIAYGQNLSALRRKIERAKVLVLAELEDSLEYAMPDAEAAIALLQAFLRRGGRLVLLAPSYELCDSLIAAGLLPPGTYPDLEVDLAELTPEGRRFGPGIARGIVPYANAMQGYRLDPRRGLVVHAAATGDQAFAFSWQVGRGEVRVLGGDLYEHNLQLRRLVLNYATVQ